MSFAPINPRPMLENLVSKQVLVRLKWGEVEYKGTLVSIDSYMNIQLSGTEEYIADKPTGSLGQVLIRYEPPIKHRMQAKIFDTNSVAMIDAITYCGCAQLMEEATRMLP